MTTTEAHTHDVPCPLPACPTRRPIGHITPAEHGQWEITSAHRPDLVALEENPYTAARWVLLQHAIFEHDSDHPDAALQVLIAGAAHALARTILGLPPIAPLPTTGECVWCGTALVFDADRSVWVDTADSDRCPDTAELCDNLCRPATPGATACSLCGGVGDILYAHEPLPVVTR